MRRMASRCAGLARSSTLGSAWPCPSWIGAGHENTPANISPSSLVPPWFPSSITIPTTASQLPWVGRALNWQGQPYEQLQWEKFRPLRCHLTSAIVASRALFLIRHKDSALCRAPAICGSNKLKLNAWRFTTHNKRDTCEAMERRIIGIAKIQRQRQSQPHQARHPVGQIAMTVLKWSLACFVAIYVLMIVGLAVFQRRLQY